MSVIIASWVTVGTWRVNNKLSLDGGIVVILLLRRMDGVTLHYHGIKRIEDYLQMRILLLLGVTVVQYNERIRTQLFTSDLNVLHHDCKDVSWESRSNGASGEAYGAMPKASRNSAPLAQPCTSTTRLKYFPSNQYPNYF